MITLNSVRLTPEQFRIIRAEAVPADRRQALDDQALADAHDILNDIRANGETSVRHHAERLGDLEPGAPLLLSRGDLQAALERVSPQNRQLLERTAARIRTFAEAQRSCLTDLAIPISGGQAGHTCIPVERAGCYAPGGRFPLPSSVLMTGITARAAGVRNVWVASPRPTDITLAAAAVADADGLLAIGGAQAIGAMTHGLAGAPPCDIIVGPGNRWVTAAKHLVSGIVGIDMLAGPSELVILADDAADPATVAADLLAQAEHDADAVPILVTPSNALSTAVREQLSRQLATLPTRASAAAALCNGFAALTSDLDEAVDICNRLAPEHLQIMTAPDVATSLVLRLRHAGALFIGSRAAEVFGDYGAGPNHVLPTGGTARFSAGLSIFTFMRVRTWLRIDGDGAEPLARDAAALARLEGLEAHARAAERRIDASA